MTDYEKLVTVIRDAKQEAFRLHMPGYDGTADRFIADAVIEAFPTLIDRRWCGCTVCGGSWVKVNA